MFARMATMVANSSSSSSSAAVVTLSTPRACDVCATRSAIWHCAADAAYLCTACDTQVHSANAVSLRHERVRLSLNGTPKKRSASQHVVPEDAAGASASSCKQPYSHHLRKLTHLSNQLASSRDVKVEDSKHSRSLTELELFDFLDAVECLNDGNQEVPSLSPGVKASPCCSGSELDFMSSDDQEGDDGQSDYSFAAFFKGKAAHSQTCSILDSDRPLATDAAPVPTDINIEFAAGDAFFFPGDIPGLVVGFDSFVPEMDLVDDFSLSFDLAYQNGLDAFEGNTNGGAATFETTGVSAEPKPSEPSPHNVLAGPFAKFFAAKSKTDPQLEPQLELPLNPEQIKREARAMLQCCQEGEDQTQKLVPALQLNLTDVLAAWSHRQEPWILGSDESTSSGSDDAGLVPDMDGNRDARVLRYKEKRRTRLFSKTIRYEVRKLNAERRPRMKGRFVKRTTATSS